MTRVEYRIEQVPLNQDGPPTLQLVERLAELGRQGWHVASVDLTPHPSYETGPVTVLLERDLDGAAPVEHQAASEASTDRDLPPQVRRSGIGRASAARVLTRTGRAG